MDAASYLNQARATYRGGVSELDAALHLLHSPEEDLEVGEVRILMEGAGETPTHPRPTNPVYDGTRPTPPVRRRVRDIPRGAQLVSRPPNGHKRALRLGQPVPVAPPPQDQGCPPQRASPLARAPRASPCSSSSSRPAGTWSGSWGHPHPPLRGSARVPPPRPGAQGAGGVAHLTANTGGHRRYGGPPCAVPPGIARRPPGAPNPVLNPDWELWRGE